MSQQITRRSVLGSIAAVSITSITGCSSSTTNENPTESPDQNSAIKSFSAQGTSIEIEFSNKDINAVQLNYDGERVKGPKPIPNSTVVTFDMGYNYEPGKYTVKGLSGEEVILEDTVTIQPDPEIVDMGLGKNNPEKIEDIINQDHPEWHIYFEIKNNGTGADKITGIQSTETPNPLYGKKDGKTYLMNPVPEKADSAPILIGAGETKLVVTEPALVTLNEEREFRCGKTHEFDITLIYKVAENTKKTLSVKTTAPTSEYDKKGSLEITDKQCDASELKVED